MEQWDSPSSLHSKSGSLCLAEAEEIIVFIRSSKGGGSSGDWIIFQWNYNQLITGRTPVFVLQQRGGEGRISHSVRELWKWLNNIDFTPLCLWLESQSSHYMKCQNHRDQSSYPALYLGISARHFQLAVFCKKIFGLERKRKLSQLSLPHPTITHHPPPPPSLRLHIKASHPSLLVPSNRFHLTVAQWSVVFWAAQLCAMKWKPLGWLDHDWGGWKSLVLGFVKQRGASKQTTHRSNFYKLTRPMVECN